jgi:hypothetical protein
MQPRRNKDNTQLLTAIADFAKIVQNGGDDVNEEVFL